MAVRIDLGRTDGSPTDTGRSDADAQRSGQEAAAGPLTITLSGLERALNWRTAVTIDRARVVDASATLRSALEPSIDRRVLGIGKHDGAFRPGRRRVGVMLGRGVDGKQFWAVPASGPELPVLVLDLADHEFRRIVLAIDDPYSQAAAIASTRSP